ncbi:MAG TPA: sigma factor-like helix-turn-helix DNA-binding protein [Planosporangium sp.]|nr:sigma factor-like helix-turn-helix DNA-binding protein [Planosporangium sp.]
MDRTGGFDAFYAASARRVVHHVYAVCGDLAEAQDVVQEAYARAWQKWSTLADYDDPEAWVRTVAWRLPEAQRRVVVLHYLYEMTVAETATSTGMPVGTVKVYLSRGRAALAALLGNDDLGNDDLGNDDREDADVVAHS